MLSVGNKLRWLLLALACLASAPALAVQPDEILADPALETRARELSRELRCMVCQNQSIDDSDAPLARDLRLLVRERLTAGDTDEHVIDYVVARYGEFVLLKPRWNVRNALLWATPVVLLLAGGAFMLYGARTKRVGEASKLSAEEDARLADILKRSEG